MKVAIIVLALISAQAVSAGPIDAALVGGALVKGAVIKGALLNTKLAVGAAKVAVGTGLAVVGAEKNLAVQGLGLAASALAGLKNQILNGTGSLEANGFCFPSFLSAQVEDPIMTCQDGYSLNVTALGQTACVKQVYSKSNTCFRSLQCPADREAMQAQEICLPPKVRGVLVGILTAFKVKATLPFMILPALKNALVKATLFPITLPKLLIGKKVEALQALPELKVKVALDPNELTPGNAIKAASTLALAGQEVVQSLLAGESPMDLVLKSLINLNITEVLGVAPQIDAWVADVLEGVAGVNNITLAINEALPNCLYRCCKEATAVDTTVALATTACAPGLRYNALLGVCTGEGAHWDSCPPATTTCTLPLGAPVCVSEALTFGLDSCRVMTVLGNVLPRVQCNGTLSG